MRRILTLIPYCLLLSGLLPPGKFADAHELQDQGTDFSGSLEITQPSDEVRQTRQELMAMLIRNAAALDEDIVHCISLCTRTIEQARIHQDDAALATAMMQRSAAQSCLLGIENSVEDFRQSMSLLPVTVADDIQLLFIQALFFRQRFLGADQTAFIPVPGGIAQKQKSLPGAHNTHLRLLCDLAESRVEVTSDCSDPLMVCTSMLPLTTSLDIRARMEFISLKSRLAAKKSISLSNAMQALKTMMRPPQFQQLSRSLRIEMLLLAAELYIAADTCHKAIPCLNEAIVESEKLGNQTIKAECKVVSMELVGSFHPNEDSESNLLAMDRLVATVNCSDILRRLQTASSQLPLSGPVSRSAFLRKLDDRLGVVEFCGLISSRAVGEWNTMRVSKMLAAQAQRISAAQLRADNEGRRSLMIARIGFGIFCALAVILLRERWQLRKANQRLEEEIRNTDQQRMEKERIELRLAQTERLESLGALAGGIAHDFNNLLVGVLGNADLLRHLEPVSPNGMQCLDGIIRSAETAAGLSRKMLAYAGKQPAMKRVIDINDIIERMLPLLRAGLGGRHQIIFRPTMCQLHTEVDAEQTDQILLNLVTNAAHATGDHNGTIEIQAGSIVLDSVPVDTPTFGNRRTGGKFVWFEVSDNGKGIAESDLARVFEPFFTTKEKSPGHGFGLAVVYGHVNRHDGLIQLSSMPGHGSRFRILLPQSAETPSLMEQADADPAPSRPLRAMRIVAVDDQQHILDVIERSLTTIGCETVTFTSATNAMEFLAENTTIDCLILDMMMPVVDGPSMLEELSNKGIQIPVVLISGYSSENPGDFSKLPLVKAVLQKPFRQEDLIAVLSRAVKIQSKTICVSDASDLNSHRVSTGTDRGTVVR